MMGEGVEMCWGLESNVVFDIQDDRFYGTGSL